MKKVLGGLAILLILGLTLAGCSGAINPGASPEARATLQPTWDDIYRAENFLKVEVNAERKNASGDKITSNAHNADFPGIYFFWDSKQKDDGILKVDAKYFLKFRTFVLTVKDANQYVDFTVKPRHGQRRTPDGFYTFRIPRGYFNDHVINMVFLNDWVKTYNMIIEDKPNPDPIESKSIVFEKKVYTDDGVELGPAEWIDDAAGWTFDIMKGEEPIAKGLKLNGEGKVVFTSELIKDGVDYTIVEHIDGYEKQYLMGSLTVGSAEVQNITILSGKDSTVDFVLNGVLYGLNPVADPFETSTWDNALKNSASSEAYDKLMSIEKDGDKAKWIWDGKYKDTLPLGISGDFTTIDNITFNIPEGFDVPTGEILFYFACDNAAVVYVNDEWAGCTTKAFGEIVGDKDNFYIYDTTTENFDGSAWDEVYTADIGSGKLVQGLNTITIYAANSAQTYGTGEESDKWDDTNNPCGLIFASSFDINKKAVAVFPNTKITYYGGGNDGEDNFSGNTLYMGIHCALNGDTGTVGTNFFEGVKSGFTYVQIVGLSIASPKTFDIVIGQDPTYEVIGTATFEIVDGDLKVTLKLNSKTFKNDASAYDFKVSKAGLLKDGGNNTDHGNWNKFYPGNGVSEYSFTIKKDDLKDFIAEIQ